MVRVLRSTILTAPVEAVWEVLRDFNGHDRWHPAVATSQVERGRASDEVGCVRRFRLADGSELREQLLTLSDLEQSFSYCLLDTPVPLFNYVAHMGPNPVTDGDRTFWEWGRAGSILPPGGRPNSAGWSARTSTSPGSMPSGRIWGWKDSPCLRSRP